MRERECISSLYLSVSVSVYVSFLRIYTVCTHPPTHPPTHPHLPTHPHRDILSATSFDVLGNTTKYLTLAINAVLLGSSTNTVALIGILLALTGSALYSPAGAFLASKLFRCPAPLFFQRFPLFFTHPRVLFYASAFDRDRGRACLCVRVSVFVSVSVL